MTHERRRDGRRRRLAELEELRADFPRFQIHDAGDHYQALLPGQIIKRPNAASLRAALGPAAEDARITDARRLIAEARDPATMLQSEMFRAVTRYQRALAELVAAIDAAASRCPDLKPRRPLLRAATLPGCRWRSVACQAAGLPGSMAGRAGSLASQTNPVTALRAGPAAGIGSNTCAVSARSGRPSHRQLVRALRGRITAAESPAHQAGHLAAS